MSKTQFARDFLKESQPKKAAVKLRDAYTAIAKLKENKTRWAFHGLEGLVNHVDRVKKLLKESLDLGENMKRCPWKRGSIMHCEDSNIPDMRKPKKEYDKCHDCDGYEIVCPENFAVYKG